MHLAANINLLIQLYQTFYGGGKSWQAQPQQCNDLFSENGPNRSFMLLGKGLTVAAAVCAETNKDNVPLMDTGLVPHQQCFAESVFLLCLL